MCFVLIQFQIQKPETTVGTRRKLWHSKILWNCSKWIRIQENWDKWKSFTLFNFVYLCVFLYNLIPWLRLLISKWFYNEEKKREKKTWELSCLINCHRISLRSLVKCGKWIFDRKLKNCHSISTACKIDHHMCVNASQYILILFNYI